MRRNLQILRSLLPTITSAAIAAGCSGSDDTSKTNGSLTDTAGNAPVQAGVTPPPANPTIPPTTPPTQPPPPSEAFDLCAGATTLALLDGVTRTSGKVDYLELRDALPPQYGTGLPYVVASSGDKCATAADKSACEADLAALESASGWEPLSFGNAPGPRHRYLVWNSGGDIGTVTSLDALRAFVAPVENAHDAALLAVASDQYRFQCDGKANAKKTATGWELNVVSGHTCGASAELDAHVLSVSTDGEVKVLSTTLLEPGNPGCAIGRRPEGLLALDVRACKDSVGAFFAEAACLEAASVEAFARLESELFSLGAPLDLVEAAQASQADEIRHARMTGRMAKRFGADPRPASIEAPRLRTPFEIALENAVEGCVRETFGALVAHHQAVEASDRAIASMMGVIAEDETRHAALAWDVAEWLEPQLTSEERASVNAARNQALAELRLALSIEPAESLRDRAGMPTASRATHLLAMLEERFLAPAA